MAGTGYHGHDGDDQCRTDRASNLTARVTNGISMGDELVLQGIDTPSINWHIGQGQTKRLNHIDTDQI